MKSRHNTTPDRPIVNATDGASDALFRACMLVPLVCIPNQQPSARGTFIAGEPDTDIGSHQQDGGQSVKLIHNIRENQKHRIADVTPGDLLWWGIVISMVAGMFLIIGCPPVLADSGPPWASTTLDNLSYTEQEGWKKLDTYVIVSSTTDNFTNGYVEVNITNANGYDELRLVNNGSLSMSGRAVYWSNNRIGTINNIYDGSNGRLRIDFSDVAPLANAGFETGDLTGWTVNNSNNQMQGQSWAEASHATPLDSDPTFDDGASDNTRTATVVSEAKHEGNYGLKLSISGTVQEGYGTDHAPSVTSSIFAAAIGDNLSLDWKAAKTTDYYDVFGFVFADTDNDGNWDAGESCQKLFHQTGEDTDGWVALNTVLTMGGDNLRFIFINGCYDQTGGTGVGSYLYIDGINLVISNTAVANNSIVSHVLENIEYNNTNDDPGTMKNYTIGFKESNEGTGFNAAYINITAVNDPPNAPASPQCEGQTNPPVVNDFTPEFRWTFSDPESGDVQGAYQIIIGMSEGSDDMWNSSKVTNTASSGISYAGSALASGTTYYWKVKTWDNKGAEGSYCADQTLTFPPPLQRINVTSTRRTLNIREYVNFNATGFNPNNDSMDNLTFGWGTTPPGVGTLNNSIGSVVNFTARHAGRTEIYAVNGSVSSNTTDSVWITVNAPSKIGNVTNRTGNATSGNSTAIVNLDNRSINGTITIEELGDPINGTKDLGNRIGIGDSKPVKGANVTVNESIEAALNDTGSYVHIRVEYNESQLGNIDENTLHIHKFVNGIGWVKLVAGKPFYCTANGRNTTANYVWVNVTNCSIFLLTGSPKATPTPSGSSGGSGTYPGWYETPTVTATKAPAAPATATDAPPGERVTPRSTKTKPAEVKATATAAEAAKNSAPAFTAVFAIVGMLAVGWLVAGRRRRRE